MERQDVEGKGGQRAGGKEGERSLSYVVITGRRRQKEGSRKGGGKQVGSGGTGRDGSNKKQAQRCDGSHTPKVPQLRRATSVSSHRCRDNPGRHTFSSRRDRLIVFMKSLFDCQSLLLPHQSHLDTKAGILNLLHPAGPLLQNDQILPERINIKSSLSFSN